MNRKVKVIIGILVALIGMTIMISKLFDKEPYTYTPEMNTSTKEVINNTTSTITPKTTKTTKKVVKTTKKAKKKKEVEKTNTRIHIKYNRQEIVNYVYQEVVRRWGEDYWDDTYKLISHESGFNPNKVNKKSGACGLFQANPCSKVIKHGYTKYYTDWKEQVRWGLDYIAVHKRYGTPKKAWAYWQKHHSY